MKFTTPQAVEDVCWTMREADLPRAENRTLINELANGVAPYSDDEVSENNIKTNVNFLEATKLLLDARRQYANAFIKPGSFFTVNLDYGPKHKRMDWAKEITNEINKPMKESRRYLETIRSQFAGVPLHGIGPVHWMDRERWVPCCIGIEDVLIPSGTLLSMDNLQHFAVFHQFTAAELWKLTHGPRVDPAWNMEMVNKAIAWALSETSKTVGYTDVYSPEKMEENFKQDLGFYGSDAIPTIDCWIFYFWSEEGKHSGWRKRIVFDSEHGDAALASQKSQIGSRNQFLYDPGDRVYAQSLDEIVHFQFGDLSAVPPFKYHTVRSLGWLVYSVCHLQNRLRSKLMDAAFESTMQFFRIPSQDAMQKVRKIDLVNYGVIPNDLAFVGRDERWQTDLGLAQIAIDYNQRVIGESSASFTQDMDFGEKQNRETATRTMAKVQSVSQMVSALLSLAYEYQEHQYTEICRRFCVKNSRDNEVREFRKRILAKGIPESALCVDYWNITAERVLGGGNKTMEMQQADALMAARPLYDPDSQRTILRRYTLAKTDDSGLTAELVPTEVNRVSDSVHDAQISISTLMDGLPITPKSGMNVQEYIEVWLMSLEQMVTQYEQRGNMAPPEKVAGMMNTSMHIGQYIQILSQNPAEKQRVRAYGDKLGELNNKIKGFAQRLQEMQKKAMEQQQGGNGVDPGKIVDAQLDMARGKQKLAVSAMSSKQKAVQKQQSFIADEKRKQDSHEMEMRRQFEQDQLEARRMAQEVANETSNQQTSD